MEMPYLVSLLSFQSSRSGHFNPGCNRGKTAEQRASEQPVFRYLSPARACMKMWCFVKGTLP
jgi:hypothetical protein